MKGRDLAAASAGHTAGTMPAHLECQSPPHAGKHLTITAEKPVTLKTNKADEEVGEVRVELVDGAVVLTNRSRMACTVNGQRQSRSVLHHDDQVTIGKQTFRVVIEDDGDGERTQFLPPVEIEEPVGPVQCSACDRVFDALDFSGGWSSGDRRICRRCFSKGVRPGNLPDPGAGPEPLQLDGGLEPAPAPGGTDESALARSESDRQRKQRRLSASRLAQVDAPGKPGIFSKVGQVFSNREERKKLDLLEQERRGLLEAAGRLALSDNNGFGLPDHLIAPLIKGATVSLRPKDFTLPALERWRSLRERLTFLDAEIAALRATLQLGPDPGAKVPDEPLRSDQVARQNRTFAMLDAMPTMDLESDEALTDETAIAPREFKIAPAPAPAPAAAKSDRRSSASGERRKPAHRRRH
jgi:hypothetical protein